MATVQSGKGFVALLKRGWLEYPHLMGSGCMAVIGLFLGSYAAYKYQTEGPYYRRFKQEYIVFRDDDPRVKLLRTD